MFSREIEMFGIGMAEMLLILVVVLIVIGPKRLPEVAKALGRGVAEFKRAADEFRNAVHSDLQGRDEDRKKGLGEPPADFPHRIGASGSDRDEEERDDPHPPLTVDGREPEKDQGGKS